MSSDLSIYLPNLFPCIQGFGYDNPFFADVMKSLRTPVLPGKILRGTSFWNKEEAIMCLLYIYICILKFGTLLRQQFHISVYPQHFSASLKDAEIDLSCKSDLFVARCSGLWAGQPCRYQHLKSQMDCVTPSQQVS